MTNYISTLMCLFIFELQLYIYNIYIYISHDNTIYTIYTIYPNPHTAWDVHTTPRSRPLRRPFVHHRRAKEANLFASFMWLVYG